MAATLFLCFRIKPEPAVSSAYLRQHFEARRLNSGLRRVTKEGATSARAHGLLSVAADGFFDLDIILPTLAEQEKIAIILDTTDQEFTLLRRQREALDSRGAD